MSMPGDEKRVVSIATLVMAMRRESVADDAIFRVLAAALGVDDATARAYAEGRPPTPVADPGELHALLVDAQERGDWPAVVALIGRITELESDPQRRARYFYTAAIVQRVELKDREAALESLEQTLDCDPSMLRAFETQCAILGEQADWKRLERAHRKMIYRVRGDAALEFTLFQALAVIYRDRLGHQSAAIEAFKTALALRPDDAGILAALQDLGA
jgi:tetratricopeptide (TPR) repeat protein